MPVTLKMPPWAVTSVRIPLSIPYYWEYIQILKEDLIPGIGYTEPIAPSNVVLASPQNSLYGQNKRLHFSGRHSIGRVKIPAPQLRGRDHSLAQNSKHSRKPGSNTKKQLSPPYHWGESLILGHCGPIPPQ